MTAMGQKKAVREIVAAYTEPGRRPDIHESAKRKLRREWPELWKAIEHLVKEM